MRKKKLVLMVALLTVALLLIAPYVASLLLVHSAQTAVLPEVNNSSQLVDGSSWTTTEVVSTESTSSAVDPSVAVGSDGTVHVAWADQTTLAPDTDLNPDIFYKKYVLGTGWTTTEVVSTESTAAAQQPSVAVGSDGTVHVTWMDYTTLSPDTDPQPDVFYKKYVLGTGWTMTEVVSTESTLKAERPSVAVGSDGTVHVTWHDWTTLPPDSDTSIDVFYKKYVLGTGWTTTEVVSTESTSQAANPVVAIDSDGTVHVTWEDLTTLPPDADPGQDVFYKKYVPGTGWTTTEVVTTESTSSAAFHSSTVSSDGKVHVTWTDWTTLPPDTDTYSDVLYKKYVPETGWTTTEVVSTESTNASAYSSVAVGSDGTVHVTWHDWTILPPDPDGYYDVFYKKYVPGTGWTTTELVSTESTNRAEYPSVAAGSDGTIHVTWQDLTTLPPDADAFGDIFYKKNVLSPTEPLTLSDLVEFPGLTHLIDLVGTEKTSKYTEIQTKVEGYDSIKSLLQSKGYGFSGDYNISIVEGTVTGIPFRGALYSHWSSFAADGGVGTRALLAAAKMDDGVDTMFGAITNLLPSQLRSSAGYTITNAMPYMYVEFYFWDKASSRIASWSYWWYDSHSHPNWFWAVYYWWRTYTKQYYSWYFYRPWWYIWHWLYWKHWNWWSTQFPY